MKHTRWITFLVAIITLLSIITTYTGIFSNEGTGTYTYTSIRGKSVAIYGKGIYKDMSAEVAPQGIAQDYVTLFVAIPALLISYVYARKNSLKAQLILIGVIKYFFITYLFYTVMAMYNKLFLLYVMLMGASFYSLVLSVASMNIKMLHERFNKAFPRKWISSFLIFSSVAILLLWLSVVVPPLLDGSIVPLQVEHYTTLIVQGFDIGILLPGAILTGIMFYRDHKLSYFLAPVYFVFLSLLMTALTAKVAGMYMLGYNVIPVIFIIPSFALLSMISALSILRSIGQKEKSS